MEPEQTKAVLEWLRDSLAIVDQDLTPENIKDVVLQVISNKEVIRDAVSEALRPEFRDIAEAISSLLAGGI